MNLSDNLAPARRLQIAVQVKSPAGLARLFAAFCGQFYDRSDFNGLARRARDLYAAESQERAVAFCRQLDRRLYDRYREPVAWEVAASSREGAA
ncbi:MAG: hypothetical protein M1401_04085 [Chloroflexi bacterium]|nr:hypothetical protein [Chloroflexota bacterium]